MESMSTTASDSSRDNRTPNFIRTIVAEDLRTGKHNGRVATRFPPGPNGYMHIGHAKAISISCGSLQVVTGYVEPAIITNPPGTNYQFERLGYFAVDSTDSTTQKPVFNRTVQLRDSWAKINK